MINWRHGIDTLESFLVYLNQIDSIGKIKFTMQVQDEDGIWFLYLKLKFESGKIAVSTVPHMCYLLFVTLEKLVLLVSLTY